MGIDRAGSVRKQTKNALERITSIEESIPQIIAGINQAFGQLNGTVTSQQEIVEAMVEMLGEADVKSKIDEIRAQKAAEQAAAQKAAVEESLAKGDLIAATVISEKTLVVGTEFDKDGKAFGAGRVQLPMAGVKPEFKEQIMGKGVGVSFELPNGGKFVVNEIYDAVEKPAAPEVPAAPVAEAPAAEPASCSGDCASCPGHLEPENTPADKV